MISCFETLELQSGKFFALPAHLDHLARTVAALDLPRLDRACLDSALELIRTGVGQGSARVRISWNDSSALTIATSGIHPHDKLAAVVMNDWCRVGAPAAVTGLKTTRYASATVLRALHPSADEAILLNEQDEISGGAYSNVFVVLDGQLITPPLESGCRDGVTRSLLIDSLRENGTEVLESPIDPERFSQATEVFLTSTTRHVQAVGWVNGKGLPDHRPFTEQASSSFARLLRDPSNWS
ncbi:MAG: aminotransferase class IV [Microthrixaceae bacterium]|nr:aminotransferase class IV [Microthrixaceae bacterium]